MASMFESDEHKDQTTRDFIGRLLQALRSDPDLRFQVRTLLGLDSESPPAPEDRTAVDATNSGWPITVDPPAPPSAEPDVTPTKVISPLDLDPPTADESFDAYVERVIRTAGWDIVMWATAVLALTDWASAAPDLKEKFTTWAQAVIDAQSSNP